MDPLRLHRHVRQESGELRSRVEIQEEKLRSLRTIQARAARATVEAGLRGWRQEQDVQHLSRLPSPRRDDGLIWLAQEDGDAYHGSDGGATAGRWYATSEDPQASAAVTPTGAGGAAARALTGRVEKLEEQMRHVAQSLQVMMTAAPPPQSLKTHMGALVEQLKSLTPKVISHEKDIQLLRSKAGHWSSL
eukprot:Skav224397  [mRNA]  locus=scaffold2452:155809:164464:- [translate_table: standard]